MSETSATEWHRLHPAMLLFQLAGILRRYFLLFVVGGVASSRGENFVSFVLFFSAFALTVGLLRYLSYRYSLDEKYITVTEGIFTKKSQRYLLGKINHVNRHQNPLAKVMGIVRLELQQEASNIPALMLPAVTFKQTEEIEQAVQRHSTHVEFSTDNTDQSTTTTDAANRTVLYQSTLAKSLLEGVSSLPIRILFVGGILYRFYGRALTPYIVDEYELYIKTLASLGIERHQQFWGFIGVSIVSGYLLALFVGVGAAVVRWFRYRVVTQSNLIFIVSGWFTRSTRVINPQQIQTILGVANPIRRLLRLSQWQIVAPRPGGQRGRASQLMPIGKSDEITSMLPAIWGACNFPRDTWLPVDPYHRRRLWLLTLFSLSVLLAIVTAVDSFFNTLAEGYLWQRIAAAPLSQQITLSVFALLLLGLFQRLVRANYASTGYQLDDNFITIQSAFLSHRTCVVPLDKIQAIIFSRSIMQMRRGLVTIELDVNGIFRPIRLYNINIDLAEKFRAKAIAIINKNNI